MRIVTNANLGVGVGVQIGSQFPEFCANQPPPAGGSVPVASYRFWGKNLGYPNWATTVPPLGGDERSAGRTRLRRPLHRG
jgi:hypothetical protein